MSTLDWRRTVAKTENLSFTWSVEGFDALRKLARLKALPSKDRLFSPEFGNADVGMWKVALFPYGDREAGRHVSLYLFGDKKHKRVAEFSMVVLDKDFREMTETFLGEEPTFFTAESNSWGWHEFLSVENDDELRPYLVNDNLRVKIRVKVYTGVSEDSSPRRLINIIQNRCNFSEDEDETDEEEDGEWADVNVPFRDETNTNNEWPDGQAASNLVAEKSAAASQGGPFLPSRLAARGAPEAGGNSGQQPNMPAAAGGPGLRGRGHSDDYTDGRRRSTARVTVAGSEVFGSSTASSRKKMASAIARRSSSGVGAELTASASAAAVGGGGRRNIRRSTHSCYCVTGGGRLPVTASASAISVDVRPSAAVGPGPQTTSAEVDITGRNIKADIAAFSKDPRAFDLTVLCEGHRFRANRFLLGARSEVLRAMLYGDFVEANQDEIEIKDVSYECLGDLLEFMASDDCTLLQSVIQCSCGCSNSHNPTSAEAANAVKKSKDESTASDSAQDADSFLRGCTTSADPTCTDGGGSMTDSSVSFVAPRDAVVLVPRLLQLMAAADKYQVLELTSRCIQMIAKCICARTVLEIMDGADRLGCTLLHDACNYYLDNSSSHRVTRIVEEIRRRQQPSQASTAVPSPATEDVTSNIIIPFNNGRVPIVASDDRTC